jgi:hypothetical protein
VYALPHFFNQEVLMAVQVFKDGLSEWIPNEQLNHHLSLGYSVTDPNVSIVHPEVIYPESMKGIESLPIENAENTILEQMGIRPPIEIVYP